MEKTQSNKIQKELERLLNIGTPRQKALFLCKNWYEPRALDLYGNKPKITEQELNDVLSSIEREDKKTKAEFRKWMNFYYQYADLIQLMGLGVAEYKNAALKLKGYLKEWETYDWESWAVNDAYQFAKEQGYKKQALDDYAKMVKRLNSERKGEELKQRKDGTFYFDVTDLYENCIKPAQQGVRATYSALKALIEVLEAHSKKHNSKGFIPALLQGNIDDAKRGYKEFNLDPRYSCEELRKRKERGEPITEEEEKRAVFPEYEALPVNAQIKAHFEQVVERRKRLV